MEQIKFKQLSPTAKLPTRNNPTDAGLDLYADEEADIQAGFRGGVGTGVAVGIPEGYYGRIAPRSGLAYKAGIDVLGGVIDSGYTGEVVVILANHGFHNLAINPGDKIAQLIISPIVTPTAVWGELSESERGEKGFGSSGR